MVILMGKKGSKLEAEVGSFSDVEREVNEIFKREDLAACVGIKINEISPVQYGGGKRFEVIYDVEGNKVKEVLEAEDREELKETLEKNFKITYQNKYLVFYKNDLAVGIYNSKEDEKKLKELFNFNSHGR